MNREKGSINPNPEGFIFLLVFKIYYFNKFLGLIPFTFTTFGTDKSGC